MVRNWERSLTAADALIYAPDAVRPMHRFAACYPCDDDQRGLVVAVYPTMRAATEDQSVNPGAKVVAAARPLVVGEFIHLDAGWSPDKPRWPSREAL
jgi:hypothetical protein